jgi:uncharacterized protein
MRVIPFESYRETPWKNGGGVTREIARSPGDGAPEWRVSLATIDRDGPFSDFSGYDRTIVPVGGAGFELRFGDGTRAVLDRRCEPFRFAGERKVECRLLARRSSDLNAMTLRSRWEHEVGAHALSSRPIELAVPASTLLFAAGGATVTCGGETYALRDGDTLACDRDAAFAVAAASPEAFALAICLTRRA